MMQLLAQKLCNNGFFYSDSFHLLRLSQETSNKHDRRSHSENDNESTMIITDC